MPTVPRLFGLRVFFYSPENGEPSHIHVAQAERTPKSWLDPVELASSEGFRSHELTRIRGLVQDHVPEIKRRWDEHFGSEDSADRP